MAAKNMLYWLNGSPACWRVLIMLEEKGLSSYPKQLLSFEKKEHKSEELLRLNPRGQVPTFVHEGHVINESLAICDYLERVYPIRDKKLLPDDHNDLALVLQRKYEVINLDKCGLDFLRHAFMTKPEHRGESKLQGRLDALAKELSIWEENLTKDGTTYIASNRLSLADVAVFPTIAISVRFGLDLSKNFPKLSSYYQKMTTERSVEKTWPSRWKETTVDRSRFWQHLNVKTDFNLK